MPRTPPDTEALMEAHVQFELDRWRPDRLGDAVAEEVQAAFGWLADTTLLDLTNAEDVSEWVSTWRDLPITDDAVAGVVAAIASARSAVREDETTVADLVPRDIYDEFVGLVVGMQDARRALIDQITTSDVYSQLIAHVMYHGIKNYLLTESPIARRVPGASSLMRLGQHALSSSGLEGGIDRQLTSFVNANISDSIRDSKDYLDTVLDEEVLGQVADEVWNSNSQATVADAVAVLPDDTVAALVRLGRDLVEHARDSETVDVVTRRAISDFFATHGDTPIAELLDEAGVSSAAVAKRITDTLTPLVERMLADGYLETRIRARLGAFYTSYQKAGSGPRRRPVSARGPAGRS